MAMSEEPFTTEFDFDPPLEHVQPFWLQNDRTSNLDTYVDLDDFALDTQPMMEYGSDPEYVRNEDDCAAQIVDDIDDRSYVPAADDLGMSYASANCNDEDDVDDDDVLSQNGNVEPTDQGLDDAEIADPFSPSEDVDGGVKLDIADPKPSPTLEDEGSEPGEIKENVTQSQTSDFIKAQERDYPKTKIDIKTGWYSSYGVNNRYYQGPLSLGSYYCGVCRKDFDTRIARDRHSRGKNHIQQRQRQIQYQKAQRNRNRKNTRSHKRQDSKYSRPWSKAESSSGNDHKTFLDCVVEGLRMKNTVTRLQEEKKEREANMKELEAKMRELTEYNKMLQTIALGTAPLSRVMEISEHAFPRN